MARISKGTPEQFMRAVENRIDELEGGLEASFVYPKDLEDLENGEYESHVTEPINAASDVDHAFSLDEVLDFLANKGYDTKNEEVVNYASAVVEYLDMCRDAWAENGERFTYGLGDWYRDTRQNYPEDLEELPKIVSSVKASIDPDRLFEFAQDTFTVSGQICGNGYGQGDTAYELYYIADEFNVSLDEARKAMIEDLGFEADQIEESEKFYKKNREVIEQNLRKRRFPIPKASKIESATTLFYDEPEPTIGEIVDWLWEHETAFEDACRFFGVPEDNEEFFSQYASEDELISWISDHPTLYNDFIEHFSYYKNIEECDSINTACNTANVAAATEDSMFDLNSKVYNALADIVYNAKYHVTQDDMVEAWEWFDTHFWDYEYEDEE